MFGHRRVPRHVPYVLRRVHHPGVDAHDLTRVHVSADEQPETRVRSRGGRLDVRREPASSEQLPRDGIARVCPGSLVRAGPQGTAHGAAHEVHLCGEVVRHLSLELVVRQPLPFPQHCIHQRLAIAVAGLEGGEDEKLVQVSQFLGPTRPAQVVARALLAEPLN